MWSLEQWLAHQSQAHPLAIDLGLDRLQRLVERLQWRQPSVPVITVAGTNGKGSVTAYCAAMLSAAGHRVGTFNSPHLRDYRERIRIHDRLVTSAELVGAFERIEQARSGDAARDEISLTFFEYNALAAFLIFESAALDAWVLEVGMGGRLDAVNLVDPTVAVVVSIGLDHQEFLGETLEAIAFEKAGVFRPARAAVLGARAMPASLMQRIESVKALPKRLGMEFDYTRVGDAWEYRGTRWTLSGLPPPALAGATQYANAAVAIAAVEELEPALAVPPEAIAAALRAVRLVGRFDVIRVAHQPEWILDVAHNPDAARVLAQNLIESPIAGRSLAVCGILADKDAAAIAAVLGGCFDAWWLASIDGVRGTSAGVLATRIAGVIPAPLALAADVAAACSAAFASATAADRIVVFGSFHTVGPALDWLEARGFLPRATDGSRA